MNDPTELGRQGHGFPAFGIAGDKEAAEIWAHRGLFTVGAREDSEGELLYIGEGDPVRPRLENHFSKKDFWNRAIAFLVTGQEGALNKAHVQYLEARLIELALVAKRLPLDNQNHPKRPTLNEADRADMKVFLGHILQILPLLGISAFEKPGMTKAIRKKQLFLSSKGVSAEGSGSASLYRLLRYHSVGCYAKDRNVR